MDEHGDFATTRHSMQCGSRWYKEEKPPQFPITENEFNGTTILMKYYVVRTGVKDHTMIKDTHNMLFDFNKVTF